MSEPPATAQTGPQAQPPSSAASEPTSGSASASQPGLTAVVAYARDRVIGRDGDMPWKLSADLRRFKQLTMGHHILMGRKTFESIGRPLPGRTSIVISRSMPVSASLPAGAEPPAAPLVCRSLEDAIAIARARGDARPMVVGGGEIYALALPLLDRVEATEIELDVAGDTRFPELAAGDWTELAREEHEPTAECSLRYAFVTLVRASNQSR